MGACCSCQMGVGHQGHLNCVKPKDSAAEDNHQVTTIGDCNCGARVRLQGSTKLVSMFTQQGRKGTNQDAMTVWENFGGQRGVVYCGVFDGHGPSGHKIARYARDTLPSKLSRLFHEHGKRTCLNHDPISSWWKTSIIKSFKGTDDDLEANTSIDSYTSGSTSVSVFKQGDSLIIANLGDSRALLCTRGNDDQLYPVQLTVDLKPSIQSERERINKCGGRVQSEAGVLRVWMPHQNFPGLAMSRAFGDFCLKDYGLICIPNIYHRKLTEQDEFVVLATDGVWDVLTNDKVIKIVGSVKKRWMAARYLVEHAVQAWRYKYPASKIDDCTVIILYFKKQRRLLPPDTMGLGADEKNTKKTDESN